MAEQKDQAYMDQVRKEYNEVLSKPNDEKKPLE